MPAGTAAGFRPASAAAPCPSGANGGVWLNGRTFNGTNLNSIKSNGFGINGTADAAETGAQRVTAVRLPDGRALAVLQR